MRKLYLDVCRHLNGSVTYSVCEYYDWSFSNQLTPDYKTEAEARAELEKMQKMTSDEMCAYVKSLWHQKRKKRR